MGEKPGGLGQREARQQPVADRVGGGRDAGVEPGQRVAGIGQRREQHRQVRARAPIAVTGCGWLPTPRAAIGVGLVRGVLPGRTEPLVRGVRVVERRVVGHSGISPSACFLWAMIADPRRFGHDRFVTRGISRGGAAAGRPIGRDNQRYCARLAHPTQRSRFWNCPKRTDASADDAHARPDQSERTATWLPRRLPVRLPARQPGAPSPSPTSMPTPCRPPTSPMCCTSPRLPSAANTRVAYDADWRAFVAWCAERDATPLPCPPGLLCAYLSSLAKTGLRPSTIGRRASGIGHVHRQHGFEPPTNAEAVKAVLRGIRRELGTARQTKTPATHDLITR